MAKLSKEQVVTIQVLHAHGSTHCEIARRLGVTEGAVRHRLRRAAMGAVDGRSAKPMLVERLGLVEAIDHWWTESQRQQSRRMARWCQASF